MVAICQYKYRTFDTAQELFNDNGCRGIAEHTSEHLFQFFLGFFESRQNQYSFSGTKSVCFQHIRSFKCFEKCQSFVQGIGCHALVAGCRYVVAVHEFFRELLTAFQPGSFFRRADNGDVFQAGVTLEVVIDTFYQRVFGAYHNHIDTFFKSECP